MREYRMDAGTESTLFRFDAQKAVQAAGVILREEPGHRINYMKLLKLMYLAERESLQETGQMITGDSVVAMRRGPVLSSVLNLIHGQHTDSAIWNEHVERERYHVSLVGNPSVKRLSRFQVQLLQKVAREHRDHDEWEMVEITHRLKEWKDNDPGNSSKPIPIREILVATGHAEDVESIIREAAAQQEMADIFAREEAACTAATPSRSLR